MIRLTRRYRFSASHRLHTPQLSEAENRELYGKCSNPFGHGHDYALEVSVKGALDSVSGRVVDLEALDRLVREQVLAPFDHKNLNAETPVFAEIAPTTENLATEIRSRLSRRWKAEFGESGPVLEGVRLHETNRNMIEVRGTK